MNKLAHVLCAAILASVSNGAFFLISSEPGGSPVIGEIGNEFEAPFSNMNWSVYRTPSSPGTLTEFNQTANQKHTFRQADSNGNGGSWLGAFAPGTWLAYLGGVHTETPILLGESALGIPPITCYAMTFRVDSFYQVPLRVEASAYDQGAGTWSDWMGYWTSGFGGVGSGTAPIIGIRSTEKNISRLRLRVRAQGTSTYGYYAIANPKVWYQPVPEPGSELVLAIGLVSLWRRHKA